MWIIALKSLCVVLVSAGLAVIIGLMVLRWIFRPDPDAGWEREQEPWSRDDDVAWGDEGAVTR